MRCPPLNQVVQAASWPGTHSRARSRRASTFSVPASYSPEMFLMIVISPPVYRPHSPVQPGIVPDLAGPGSGYQAGDILTLGGGVFTRPARFVLNAPSPNGGLCDPARPATNGNTYVIDMGDYSVFPTNPANVTGGHGTGGKVIYTNANIKARGSGYKSGDVLRGSTGTSRFPVLVRVNIIDANGAVLEAEILFGGYYTGTLPTEMAFAAYDTVSSGSGFTLLPCFGNRYAMQYSKPSMASGGSILGIGNRNVIVSGNSIVNHSPSHDCG